ncbi:hypothetical protein [Roseomonas elaeocarpi]|uniref:Uncharacterized protein n=1 Tax=Roseomonas elaeocarpi TaxID=907779 RepID=A0ABV6JNZ2_9PROT
MAPWSWSDRRVLAPGLVLAAASVVHVAAVVLALHPRVDEAYVARYIERTSRCLRHPPAPVVASLPARLVPFDGSSDGQRCPALLWAGWHPAEPGLAWSSSGRAVIVLTLLPEVSARRLTLYFPQMLGAALHPRTLRVLVDGVPAASARIDRAGPFETSVAGERLTPGATHRIELLLDRLYTPRELGLGEDERSLGVALAAIILE